MYENSSARSWVKPNAKRSYLQAIMFRSDATGQASDHVNAEFRDSLTTNSRQLAAMQ